MGRYAPEFTVYYTTIVIMWTKKLSSHMHLSAVDKQFPVISPYIGHINVSGHHQQHSSVCRKIMPSFNMGMHANIVTNYSIYCESINYSCAWSSELWGKNWSQLVLKKLPWIGPTHSLKPRCTHTHTRTHAYTHIILHRLSTVEHLSGRMCVGKACRLGTQMQRRYMESFSAT